MGEWLSVLLFIFRIRSRAFSALSLSSLLSLFLPPPSPLPVT